jgi:HNH endonuclease
MLKACSFNPGPNTNGGFCHCGCGVLAPIATHSNRQDGTIKGRPVRFVKGHNSRSASYHTRGGKRKWGEYLAVLMPQHPRANNGFVFEHILVAERALGKPLAPGAECHHVDGNPLNNLPSNLVICQDHQYHMLLHMRAKALKESGHVHWRMCHYCKRYDSPANLYVPKRGTAHHRACHTAYGVARRRCQRQARATMIHTTA